MAKSTFVDKSYELYPGIRVTDADDIEFNHGKRLDCSKFKQFDVSLNGSTYPIQSVCDKIAKNKNLSIATSFYDFKNNGIVYDVVVNANTISTIFIAKKEICDTYNWKDYTISEDGMTMIPVK